MTRKRGKYVKQCGKEICDRLGIPRSKLYTLRNYNPEAFAYIMSFDDEPVKAYLKYEEHRENVRNKACEIIYWLTDHRLKREYGRFLARKGVYKTFESFNSSSNTVLYSSKGITKYTTLRIYEKVVALFDEFLDEQNIKIEL